MKKGITMLMFMLACCLFVSAQSDTSSDSMKKDQMQDSTQMHSQMMGKQITMTGCIAEKDGKYMMMNKKHPEGVLLMGSTDMKPHVGHKVSVTGMMEKMSDDSMKTDNKMKPDTMAKDDKMMTHDDMGMMDMNVTSMKMMSTKCDMSEMSK